MLGEITAQSAKMCRDIYRQYDRCGCRLYAVLQECDLGPRHRDCVREEGVVRKGDIKCPYHEKFPRYREKYPYHNKPPKFCLWRDRFPDAKTLDNVPRYIKSGRTTPGWDDPETNDPYYNTADSLEREGKRKEESDEFWGFSKKKQNKSALASVAAKVSALKPAALQQRILDDDVFMLNDSSGPEHFTIRRKIFANGHT
jgi:hypothetical protein